MDTAGRATITRGGFIFQQSLTVLPCRCSSVAAPLTVSQVHDGSRQRGEVGVLQRLLGRDPLGRNLRQQPAQQLLRLGRQLVQPVREAHMLAG